MVVNDLYYGSDPFVPVNVSATPIDLSNAVQKALKDIYAKRINPYAEIHPELFRGFADTFDLAAAKGFNDAEELTPEYRRKVVHSNEVFSAFKAHRMQEDIASRLLDDGGNLKTFARFKEDVRDITSHQCGRWLRTEYDTAVKRASLAADWQRFEREKDVLPNLRWVPSTAATPDAAHMALWNTVLPVDHPFWSTHRPGDRWGCQCSLEATDDPVTASPTAGYAADQGLDNNPGKDGKLFSESHPYFPDNCSSCPFYGRPSSGTPTNMVKDCGSCQYIGSVLENAKEKLDNGNELSPEIQERLKLYWKLEADRNYENVDFNETAGGMGGVKATHIGHKKSNKNEAIVYGKYTGKDLETHCQDNLFRMGETCILENESLKIKGKNPCCLDATIMGERMDIASITKGDGQIFFNTITRKEKQILGFNRAFNENAHCLALYFEEPSMFDKAKVEESFTRYLDLNHHVIDTLYCIVNGAEKPVIIK